MIGLVKELPEHDNTYELNRLIGVLLSDKLNLTEKLEICENEYNIPIHDNMRKDVNIMCNLGQGIENRAIDKCTIELVKSMYDNGIPVAKIVEITKKDMAEIENILTDKITLV